MVAPALPVPLSLKMIREPSANISRKPWKKISKGFSWRMLRGRLQTGRQEGSM